MDAALGFVVWCLVETPIIQGKKDTLRISRANLADLEINP